MKYLIFIFLSAFVLLSASAQKNMQTDSLYEDQSTQIQIRSSEVPAELSSKSDFDYTQGEKKPPVGFWAILGTWIWDILTAMMSSPFWKVIFYIIIFGIMLFIIIKLLGFQYSGLWLRARKTKGFASGEIYDDDIHSVNFKGEIAKALKKKNYRKAVRFHYLMLLKTFSDKEIIEWEPDKTNTEYQAEIEAGGFGKTFKKLTLIYEYVWYGDFSVNKSFYNKTSEDFRKIITKI